MPTDPVMDRFRRLIFTAVLAGAAAGLVLFALQQVTVMPLIAAAEVFEDAADRSRPVDVHEEIAAHGDGHADRHDAEAGQPTPGPQRIGLTALTTVMSGIGFAAVLLAAISLAGRPATVGQGVIWGLAGFACFVLAPALGLPPKPLGAAVGDLHARQIWWLGTVVATAVALGCLGFGAGWWRRALGALLLAAPHVIGAPAQEGIDVAPWELMRDFALLSVATNLVFWLLLGAMCGWLLQRDAQRSQAAAA